MRSLTDDEEDVVVQNAVIDFILNITDSESEEYPIKKDGTGRRAVNRRNYSRTPKEPKSSEDPKVSLTWMKWISDANVDCQCSKRC